MISVRVLVYFLLLFMTNGATALAEEKANGLFEDALLALEAKNYEDAIHNLNALVAEEVISAQLYAKLAKAHEGRSQKGYAIVSLLRGLMLEPRNEELRKQLRHVRAKVLYRHQPSIQKSTVLGRTSILERQLISFVLASLCCLLLVGWLLWQKPLLLYVGGFFGGLTVFWLFLAHTTVFDTGMQVLGRVQSSNTRGVITSEKASIYAAPNTKSQIIALLPDGAEVGVGLVQSEWIQLYLPADRNGWVLRSDIKIVDLGEFYNPQQHAPQG